MINCWSSVVASVVSPQLCNLHFSKNFVFFCMLGKRGLFHIDFGICEDFMEKQKNRRPKRKKKKEEEKEEKLKKNCQKGGGGKGGKSTTLKKQK